MYITNLVRETRAMLQPFALSLHRPGTAATGGGPYVREGACRWMAR